MNRFRNVIITLFIMAFVVMSCRQNNKSHNNSNQNSIQLKKINIVAHNYKSTSIPLFISSLLQNHISDFLAVYSIEFAKFCSYYKLNASDTSNIHKYYTIKILHELFTCYGAQNCSVGEVINIPYYWHCIKPEPRNTIIYVENGMQLKDIKPPKEYSKYRNYADIDRTPPLFICDLFEAKAKYYTASCDTFYSFGWCSEREMSFVCLTDLLNYKGKIVVEGNHCWSEFVINMNTINSKTKTFKVKIDNTFNIFEWDSISEIDIRKWEHYLGNTQEKDWYNKEAHSINNKEKLAKFIVSQQAINRFEKSIVTYLNRKIN